MSCRTSSKSLLPLGALLGLAVLVVALGAGCGKANPVAPSGSTITLSANPSAITSPSGTSTITAVVRKPNGTVAAGVDVRFTASLGTIDTLVRTDSGGVATATLKGDGRSGTAMVNAVVDGGATAAMALSVPIGGGAKTITLQAIPANVAATGGTAQLVALVRDATGQPAQGVSVNFSTNVGTLASKGAFRSTNASGEATDTLTIQASDITNQTSVTVGAAAAAPDGTLQTATFTVSILNINAAASIVVQASTTQLPIGTGGTVTLTALVRNTSGGAVKGAGVNFTATGASNTTLDSGGGIRNTDDNGQVTDKLTVPPQSGAVPITITVQAFTPGTGSTLISSNTVTITLK